MSVLVTMRAQVADPTGFRDLVQQRSDELEAIAEDAKGKGCLSHRFGVGEDCFLVLDEWESAEQFQSFFEGNAEAAQLMQAAGLQGEPQITIVEAIAKTTAGQF